MSQHASPKTRLIFEELLAGVSEAENARQIQAQEARLAQLNAAKKDKDLKSRSENRLGKLQLRLKESLAADQEPAEGEAKAPTPAEQQKQADFDTGADIGFQGGGISGGIAQIPRTNFGKAAASVSGADPRDVTGGKLVKTGQAGPGVPAAGPAGAGAPAGTPTPAAGGPDPNSISELIRRGDVGGLSRLKSTTVPNRSGRTVKPAASVSELQKAIQERVKIVERSSEGIADAMTRKFIGTGSDEEVRRQMDIIEDRFGASIANAARDRAEALSLKARLNIDLERQKAKRAKKETDSLVRAGRLTDIRKDARVNVFAENGISLTDFGMFNIITGEQTSIERIGPDRFRKLNILSTERFLSLLDVASNKEVDNIETTLTNELGQPPTLEQLTFAIVGRLGKSPPLSNPESSREALPLTGGSESILTNRLSGEGREQTIEALRKQVLDRFKRLR